MSSLSIKVGSFSLSVVYRECFADLFSAEIVERVVQEEIDDSQPGAPSKYLTRIDSFSLSYNGWGMSPIKLSCILVVMNNIPK